MYPKAFGKYVLERELSRGGMARVLLATLKGAGGFEKKLVVKQIRDELSHDGEFVRRFVDEAKTTVALSHPNIVPVYELGVEEGTYYLAMELVSGVSVAELLKADREAAGKRVGLSAEEGAYLGAEVCRALDYAHRRMKVVHRDITPRNVMVDEEGQVKLIDFGIAAPARVAGHEVFGSPGHMPPEQMAGRELGPATDVFALAVLLMEAWSGRAPFRRATLEDCEKAMAGPHPKPSDAHPDLLPLDDVFARAMMLDPDERQQDADELGRALRAFLKGRETEDLARKLGERVRASREASEPASAIPSTGGPGTRKLSDGSDAEEPAVYTRTFATRESEVGPSTRRIASIPPPADDAPVATKPSPSSSSSPSKAAPKSEARRAASATPDDDDDDAPEKLETIATRPLETPARLDLSESVARRKAPKNRLYFAVGLVGLVAVGVALARRGSLEGSSGTSTLEDAGLASSAKDAATQVTSVTSSEAVGSASAASAASASASVTAAPSGSASGSVAAPTLPPSAGTSSAGTPRPVTPASATTQPAVPKATLVLLGDFGTKVTVDGISRGRTPTRVAVDPGPHDVRFVFEPTGESRGERLTTRSGEQVTLRAEFTGASPTVRIQR
jgi:serine/threonine-protein kinase